MIMKQKKELKLIDTLYDGLKERIIKREDNIENIIGYIGQKTRQNNTKYAILSTLPWVDIAVEYYFNYSGNKIVSPIVENVGKYYDDYVETFIAEIVGDICLGKFGDKWERLAKAMLAEYNIDEEIYLSTKRDGANEDILHREFNSEIDGSEASKIKVTDNNTDTESVWGYNSTDAVPSGQSVGNSTTITEGNSDDNTSHSEKHDNTDDRKNMTIDETEIYKGRKKPMVDLIEKEINFRNSRVLWNIIFTDIDSVATIGMY